MPDRLFSRLQMTGTTLAFCGADQQTGGMLRTPRVAGPAWKQRRQSNNAGYEFGTLRMPDGSSDARARSLWTGASTQEACLIANGHGHRWPADREDNPVKPDLPS
ncbi:hypothetical protein BaRGS_00005123 [Batillaria attramentaria]|uniref:Uncharacterized protein n=1 Tax=Batillaria attramentaria TaxID=370345 RepID=A0ABD0LVB7_9CAEN